MRAVMVSDAHLVDLQDQAQVEWVSWLDALEADQLILLGDIFHTWWGLWRELQPEYLPAIEALRRVRARGITIRVVPGNHDFALGPFFEQELEADIREAHGLELAGHSMFLAHGDEIDKSMGYRVARTVLRGALFRGLMALLGRRLGTRLLRRLAGSSRAHNPTPGPLLEAQRVWARALHREGAELVVMGHLHCPGMEVWETGCFVQLGDWVEHRTWLELDEEGAVLYGLERTERRVLGRWEPEKSS
jgi:UDP-2,3-diacylglucosamine hydrolase